MFVQHIWNLFQLLGLVTCRKLANLSSRTLSLKRANNILKLPGVDYVAKNWALAMMLKALPLVHFWNVLLLKEQMMTSLRKICLANNHKIGRFLPIAFWWSLPPNSRKITAKSANFSLNFVPKNPAKNGTFSSVTYQKPLQIHIWNPWLLDLLRKHWFVSSAWNFCHWVADVPLHGTSQRWRARRNGCFCGRKLIVWLTNWNFHGNYNFFDEKHALMMALKFQNFVGEPSPRPN